MKTTVISDNAPTGLESAASAEPGIVYGRVSTKEQDVKMQALRLGPYCERMGIEIGGRYIYESAVKGGKAIWERPDGKEIVRYILEGEKSGTPIRHLIVTHPDRIARDELAWHTFRPWLVEHHITLHVLDMGGELKSDDPGTRFMLSVLVAAAAYDLGLRNKRITDKLNQKFDADELIGTVPYGKDAIPSPDGRLNKRSKPVRVLVDNETEQRWLLLMVEWRKAGLSYHRIAMELNRLGVPTKNGGGRVVIRIDKVTNERIPIGVTSGKWQMSMVIKILESNHTKRWLAQREALNL